MSTTISTLDSNEINFIYKNINLEKNNILNEINSYKQIKKNNDNYYSEYELKINKFNPQKKIINNNWEKRLINRINSLTNILDSN
jgi:hypothetical protein